MCQINGAPVWQGVNSKLLSQIQPTGNNLSLDWFMSHSILLIPPKNSILVSIVLFVLWRDMYMPRESMGGGLCQLSDLGQWNSKKKNRYSVVCYWEAWSRLFRGSIKVMTLSPKAWVKSISWPHAEVLTRLLLFHRKCGRTVYDDEWHVFQGWMDPRADRVTTT